jgi:hypothetical protein
MSQTIESYLVSLGFSIKNDELSKFNQSIQGAGKVVKETTSGSNGIVGDLFKMQFALTSAFAAVGAGVIAMADKVAMADQSFRLNAMTAFMTKDAYRSMDVSLKALGATIDQVAWDPELHQRFLELQADQKAMAFTLGPDFEKNMSGIRDLRFEWSRFTVELQYLSMGVVNDLFTKLGFGSGDLAAKLKGLNDWLIADLPHISDVIANDLVPVLKTLWRTLEDIGEVAKDAFLIFQNAVALFTGDDSLRGTTANFDTFAKTLTHVVNGVDDLARAFLDLEEAILHLDLSKITGKDLGLLGGAALLTGSGRGLAWKGLKGLGGLLGAGGAEAAVGETAVAEASTGVGIPLAIATGAGIAGYEGYKHWDSIKQLFASSDTGQPSVAEHLSSLAASISKNTGIPPELLYGQLMHESGQGTNRGARDLHNYSGVKGPDGQYRDFHTDAEYISFLSRMFTDKKYSATGLLAAKNAGEYANDLKKAGYYGDSVSNYTRGIERFAGGYVAPSITVGDINVTVAKTNASPDDIGRAVKSHVQSIATQQNVVGQANATGVHQ